MREKLFGLERNFDNAIVTFRLLALLVHAVARSSLVIEDARRSQGRNDQTSLSDNTKSLQLSGRRWTTQVMNTTFKTDGFIIHLFTFLLLFSLFRVKFFPMCHHTCFFRILCPEQKSQEILNSIIGERNITRKLWCFPSWISDSSNMTKWLKLNTILKDFLF